MINYITNNNFTINLNSNNYTNKTLSIKNDSNYFHFHNENSKVILNKKNRVNLYEEQSKIINTKKLLNLKRKEEYSKKYIFDKDSKIEKTISYNNNNTNIINNKNSISDKRKYLMNKIKIYSLNRNMKTITNENRAIYKEEKNKNLKNYNFQKINNKEEKYIKYKKDIFEKFSKNIGVNKFGKKMEINIEINKKKLKNDTKKIFQKKSLIAKTQQVTDNTVEKLKEKKIDNYKTEINKVDSNKKENKDKIDEKIIDKNNTEINKENKKEKKINENNIEKNKDKDKDIENEIEIKNNKENINQNCIELNIDDIRIKDIKINKKKNIKEIDVNKDKTKEINKKELNEEEKNNNILKSIEKNNDEQSDLLKKENNDKEEQLIKDNMEEINNINNEDLNNKNESYEEKSVICYIDITKIKSNCQIPKEYINIIYRNLLIEEDIGLKLKPSYEKIKSQKEINEQMRSILVDWIIDVHYKFGFTDETLFMTILIIDRYISIKPISKLKFQLLGITALLIACKHEEINLPKIEDFIYITDNAYTKDEVFIMEKDILNTFNFELLYPSPIKFYEIFILKFNFDKKNYLMGKYLMESFLIDLKWVKYKPSVISCACVYIVMKFYKMKNYHESYKKKYYNLNENDFHNPKFNNEYDIKECAKLICSFVDNINNFNFLSCKKKYASKENEEISLIVEGQNS